MELRRLTVALGLNPDQREKLRPIITDEGDQLSAVRLNEYLTPDQKKAKMQEIRESFSSKVAAVLTPEQREKWKKMQEGPQAPAPGAKLEGKQWFRGPSEAQSFRNTPEKRADCTERS